MAIKYWQCNECKVMYPLNARPDICVCGNDMSSNSTKRDILYLAELKNRKTKKNRG